MKRQRSRRFARIRTDVDDGMTVLYGRFDPVTGARIETVLSAKMGELWREEDPGNRRSAGQRMADALEQLLTGPRQAKNGRVQDVKLLLIADYDTVHEPTGGRSFGRWDPASGRGVAPVGLRRADPARHLRGRVATIGRGPGEDEPPPAPSEPCSSPGTGPVWDAAPKPPGAKRTTSSTGPTEAPPAWTTWSFYAADATTKSTTTTGKYAKPPPDNTPSTGRSPDTNQKPTTAEPHTDDDTPPNKENEFG